MLKLVHNSKYFWKSSKEHLRFGNFDLAILETSNIKNSSTKKKGRGKRKRQRLRKMSRTEIKWPGPSRIEIECPGPSETGEIPVQNESWFMGKKNHMFISGNQHYVHLAENAVPGSYSMDGKTADLLTKLPEFQPWV
jgi:hypothetical protein